MSINEPIEKPLREAYHQILSQRLTGALTVDSGSTRRRLYFYRGKLAYASSNYNPEHLGEILVSLKKISRGTLNNILTEKGTSDKKIGELLLAKNLIHHRDVYIGLLWQLIQIVYSILSIHTGTWKFTQDLSELDGHTVFNLNLANIIHHYCKHPHRLFRFKYRHFHSLVRVDPIPGSMISILDGEDVDFITLLGQHPNHTAGQLLVMSKREEVTFWRQCLFFYTLGLLSFERNCARPEGDSMGDSQKNSELNAVIGSEDIGTPADFSQMDESGKISFLTLMKTLKR